MSAEQKKKIAAGVKKYGHEGMVDLKNTVKKLADASLLLRRIPMRHVKMLNSVLDDEE